MKPVNLSEIEQLFDQMPLAEKLLLIERLVRRMRKEAAADEEFEREMVAMAQDPDIQRELKGAELPTTGDEPQTEPAA